MEIYNSLILGVARLNEVISLGCTINYLQKDNGTLEAFYEGVVSPFIQVTGGHSISFSIKGAVGFQGKYYFCEFDSSKTKVDDWNYQGSPYRTITLNSSTRYIRTCFMLDLFEEVYIKDETTSTYIWGPFNT